MKHTFLCAWIDSAVFHGYNRRIIDVYHILCIHEMATDEQRFAACTLKQIRKALLNQDFNTASDIIAQCENLPAFAEYAEVLHNFGRTLYTRMLHV